MQPKLMLIWFDGELCTFLIVERLIGKKGAVELGRLSIDPIQSLERLKLGSAVKMLLLLRTLKSFAAELRYCVFGSKNEPCVYLDIHMSWYRIWKVAQTPLSQEIFSNLIELSEGAAPLRTLLQSTTLYIPS